MVATIGILVGSLGRGSNMKAIVEACWRGELDASVQVVVAPKPEAPAAMWAQSAGIRVVCLSREYPNYPTELIKALSGCSLICLAGYMNLLPTEVLKAHPRSVLNIHPSLLPKYGGKGMYGLRVHQAVIDAGETETGCTVHYVNEEYDEGEIILQLKCPVLITDTAEVLAARVLELEHRAYPQAIRRILTRYAS